MTNTYLYGEGVEVPTISQELIDKRVSLLNGNLQKLLAVDYTVRDTVRINKIISAIRFWTHINDKDK